MREDTSDTPAETAEQEAQSKPPGPIRVFLRGNIHRILLGLTILSTLYIGYLSVVDYRISQGAFLPTARGDILFWFFYPEFLFPALAYTAGLLGFLTAHEMGHYYMCRHYGLPATPPYYLPNPLIFGTFGAVIKIKAPIRNKKVLFDVGIAGPLSGFAVALPLLVFGLLISITLPAGQLGAGGGGYLILGDPILQRFLEPLVFGVSGGIDIVMSPLAMVGWFGCLVTAINLLPVSQLDGGHILYAVFGRYHGIVSHLVVLSMIATALITQYWGWLLWALLVALFGLRHPRLVDENERLDGARLLLSVLALLILVVCFMPVPIDVPEFFDGREQQVPYEGENPGALPGRAETVSITGLRA